MLLELMSLAPLQDDWDGNWVLWLRCFVTSFLLSLGIRMQFHTLVPLAHLSKVAIVWISIAAACGYAIGLARYWAFPVPFAVTMGTPSWLITLVSCSVAVIGWSNIRKSKRLREQLRSLVATGIIQYHMLIAYPAYNAGFIRLSGWDQLAFILVLPAVKVFMKRILYRVVGHTEPGLVLAITSADLFQALYLFKCMQSAGSIQSGIALIAVDLMQSIYHLHALHRKVRAIQEHLGHQLVTRDFIASFVQ